MSDDPIEQIQFRAKGHLGRELTPAEMATEFAKWDIGERVKTLESLNADTDPLTIDQAARRVKYENALRGTHEILRKVGR